MNEKSGQQMKEITKQLEEGIRQLYDSDKYAAWLDVMSKFHSYSFRNCMLIAMQKPDATYVAQKTADGIITGIEEKQKVLDKGIANEKAVLYPGTDEPENIIKM